MRTAKLFKNGQSQAVRLPKEFRFEGEEVFIKKEGDVVVLIPKQEDRWANVKNTIGKFKKPITRDQPKEQQKRGFGWH